MPVVVNDNTYSILKFPDKETQATSNIPFCRAKLDQSHEINRHPNQGETNHVFTLGKKDERPSFVARVNFCGKDSIHYWQNNFNRSFIARDMLPDDLKTLTPKVIKMGSITNTTIPFCYIIEEFKRGENVINNLVTISRKDILQQLGCLSSQLNSIKVNGIGSAEVFIQDQFQNRSSLGLGSIYDYINIFLYRVEKQLSGPLKGRLKQLEKSRIRDGLKYLKLKDWDSVGLCQGDLNLSNILMQEERLSCSVEKGVSSGLKMCL